jgi:site-specific DNA-methyltransferase (adenine-specific)
MSAFSFPIWAIVPEKMRQVTVGVKKSKATRKSGYSANMESHGVPEPKEHRPFWKSPEASLFKANSIDWMRTIPAGSVDCIWTDPPYKLSNGGITCIAGKMVSVNKGDWDKSEGVALDHEFNFSWLRECKRILTPAGSIWVSGTLHVYLSVGMAMQQLGFRLLNDIIWEKPAPPPNLGCRCFTHSTEILLWATKASKSSKEKYTFNYDDMRRENGGKQMKNVWRFATPSTDEKRFGKHPTQKPVSLVARCLRASTRPGDLVLDPFAGSATTGVAALQEGRRFWGCERDDVHADLAVRRLGAASKQPRTNLNGKDAERADFTLFDL